MSPSNPASSAGGAQSAGGVQGNGSAAPRGEAPLSAVHAWPLRRFGANREFEVPDLVELQTRSYAAFLQEDVPADHRTDAGLESIMREVFPIPSYDGTMSLEYLGYDLGAPRYTPDECRELRLTYGRPFKIRVKLQKETAVEEEVYLGEIPIMVGGGEFIVNGTERVIVTQMHRSPGVDFSVDTHSTDKKLPSGWSIPERGSWFGPDTDADAWFDSYNKNVLSAVRLVRAYAPAMREKGWGRIVLLGTVRSVRPCTVRAQYDGATIEELPALTVEVDRLIEVGQRLVTIATVVLGHAARLIRARKAGL